MQVPMKETALTRYADNLGRLSEQMRTATREQVQHLLKEVYRAEIPRFPDFTFRGSDREYEIVFLENEK